MSEVIQRICPECGQPFVSSYRQQVCCSPACAELRRLRIRRERSAAKQTKHTCVVCGEEFWTAFAQQVCCSPTCRKKHLAALKRASRRRPDGTTRPRGRPRKEVQPSRLDELRAERRDAEVRRRVFLARRDLEHKSLHVPVKVTVDHRGIRREVRGHCCGGGISAHGAVRDGRILNLGF